MRTALIIPTLNAERQNFRQILEAISKQQLKPDVLLIMDSGSEDNTVEIAREFDFDVFNVSKGTFDHSATRKLGINLVAERADIVLFMTQDALLKDKQGLLNLTSAFEDSRISAAYGRQLPRDQASEIERFARLFNYPQKSEKRFLEDYSKYGMKVAFCSDSFAAYRIEHILKFNAFPDRSIVGEDYITVANLLLKGQGVQYCSEAQVIHSHDYSIRQEFSRYFDIGVFHSEYQSILKQLGTTEKAGQAFVKAELKHLWQNSPFLIPSALLRTAVKYIGYRFGRHHQVFPKKWQRKFAMHSYYFKD